MKMQSKFRFIAH